LRSALGSTLSLARFKYKRGNSWETAMRKVSEYERQAAECRKLAAQMKTLEQRKQLEDAAEVWDRLARERRQGVIANETEEKQNNLC
jgi:outer membrane PBP1 activator LpoA protein